MPSLAPRCRRRGAADILLLRAVALGVAATLGIGVPCLQGQSEDDSEGRSWRLKGLRTGFCVQLLVDPSSVASELPREYRPLPASRSPDLHPALQNVIKSQPEFGSWSPSRLCLYYFDTVQVSSTVLRNKNPSKKPLLGLWTVKVAEAASGKPRELLLDMLGNSGRLERFGKRAGVYVHEVESSFGKVPVVDRDGIPSSDDQYRLKFRGTEIIWDGRLTADSSRVQGVLSSEWVTQGAQAGWVSGHLRLSPGWRHQMVGSLRVEGKNDFARVLKASPIKFVGPLLQQGNGELSFRPQ